jgi:shikimate 5-dehydrogenase
MQRAVTFLRGKHYALVSTEVDAEELEDAIKALKNLGFNVTMDVKFED